MLFLFFRNQILAMNSFVMFSQRAWICVPFKAVYHFAVIRFGLRMCPCMFISVTWIWVPFITTCHRASIGLLSCVWSRVNFQVLKPWKAFPTRVMGTSVGSLASMCSHVYQHFVPGIEALSIAWAPLPKATVFTSFSPNVVFIDMRDKIFQRQKVFTTIFPFALVEFR